jgi:ABC-type spermidine/putrescine transport system permease subunit II
MVLSLALGFPAAMALARDETSAISHGLDAILMLPLGTSAVTLGLGFIVALDKPPLDLRSSFLLVPLAHTLVAFPFVVRNLTPALRSIRPRMRQAAAVLGATPGQVIRFIDLPLIGRSILVAATFAFTISMGEFGATSLIARPQYNHSHRHLPIDPATGRDQLWAGTGSQHDPDGGGRSRHADYQPFTHWRGGGILITHSIGDYVNP